MRFYKTKKGYVCVNEGNSRYFEDNFEYSKSWKIVSQTFSVPKSDKKAYGDITTEEFEAYLDKVISRYEAVLKRLKRIQREEFNK